MTQATLQRFVFRLAVVVGFAGLWPGGPVTSATATAALCILLATGCFVSAIVLREPFHGAGLNHWHEGMALWAIALFVHLVFR